MNYKKVFKRETKVIAYVVICLTLAVMGISYALFLQVNNNTRNQIVTTGSLQIEFPHDSAIIINEADEFNNCLMPQTDEEAINGACNFNFSVTNKSSGNLPYQYSVLLYDDESEIPDVNLKLDHSYIKFSLTKTVGETTTTIVSNKYLNEATLKESKRIILENNFINVGETAVFNLKVWIDEDTAPSEGEDSIIGKYVYLKIDVTGTVYENETATQALTATMDTSGLSEVMSPTSYSSDTNIDAIKEYRYTGKNPNNYIAFNCSNDEDVSTCEVWRALGIYNIDNESRIKLIKDTNEEMKPWDEAAGVVYSTSSLNTYLNAYYSNLSETAKGQIGAATYKLGGAETLELDSKTMYGFELESDEVLSLNVGLMNVSDYAFASSLKEEEFVSTIASRNENNWLFTGKEEWLVNKDVNNQVYKISTDGSIGVGATNEAKLIRPVVALQSSVKIIGGDGTKENPYRLSK